MKSVLPSNSKIIKYIQLIYSRYSHTHPEVDFMTNANLPKLLFILDSQVQVIELEGDCYLIHCGGKEHSTKNPTAFQHNCKLVLQLHYVGNVIVCGIMKLENKSGKHKIFMNRFNQVAIVLSPHYLLIA